MKHSSHCCSLGDVICKASGEAPTFAPCYELKGFSLEGRVWVHSAAFLNTAEKVVESDNHSEKNTSADGWKTKRKKLKGKRAVVRWLKFFRYKKKKEYGRMTAEEKILYKLRKVSFQFAIICNLILLKTKHLLLASF